MTVQATGNSHPPPAKKKPDYGFPVEGTWWFDSDRAKAIGYTL